MEVTSEQSDSQTGDQNSFFVNSEGLKIYCKYWHSQSNKQQTLRAAVFICHGMAQHCQGYMKLASRLNDCNMLVFSHDHVGHGLSEGERVQISDFSTYCKDVVQHVSIIKDKHPNIPVFIIGYSMGGSISVKVALENVDMFAGVVLIAPSLIACPRWLTTSTPANFVVRQFSYLFPRFQITSLDPHLMSRDPQITCTTFGVKMLTTNEEIEF